MFNLQMNADTKKAKLSIAEILNEITT